MKNPKVLVACEESQVVCTAFREMGIEAYSCDIQEASGGHPEWHIFGDVTKILTPYPIRISRDKVRMGIEFYTNYGQEIHTIFGGWDLIIAHPPCTFLSCAGAQRLFRKGNIVVDDDRYLKAVEAAEFFKIFLDLPCKHVAVENPNIMRHKFGIKKYDQQIEPFMFGHPWRKRTNLWLKNLPKLQPTEIVEPTGYWVQRSGKRGKGCHGHRSAKIRARTFEGIGKAMASQWGTYLLNLEEDTNA